MANNFSNKISSSGRDVEEILVYLLNEILNILDENLIGLYLFGSLTYGDFNPESSDIDLVAILAKPPDSVQLDRIKLFHNITKEQYKKWGCRLECSYTPIDLFKNTLPPKEPRPYYGGGLFFEEAPYGNEWIINNYLLYQHGIALVGPDFRDLVKSIDIIEVQKACIRDLFQEWEPKITDYEWLENSHYQSYLVMNLCRILYTVICGIAGTKKAAATWVKNKFKLPWLDNLIEVAENWNYNKNMLFRNEAINFLKLTIDQIKKTPLYKEMYP